MIRLTKEEENAVALAQLGAAADSFDFPYSPHKWRTRRWSLLRPLPGGGLRLLVAVARKVGEVRGVASWRVGDRYWALESCHEWHYVAGWLTRWDMPPDKGAPGTVRCIEDRGAEVPRWGWPPLVNATAAADTPWEWLARAADAGRVDPTALPRYFLISRRFPRVELLAKAGFPDEWISERILARMELDADYARFVAANAETIRDRRLLPRDAFRAWSNGWGAERMAEEAEVRTRWHGIGLYGVNIRAAEKYVAKLEEAAEAFSAGCCGRALLTVTRTDYSRYLRTARAVGLDTLDHGVAFPRDFFAAKERVEAEHERREAARLAALRKEESARAREAAARAREESRRRMKEGRERIAAIVPLVAKLALPKGWRVVPLLEQADLRAEGKIMHNCIGSGGYRGATERGECLCFSVQGPDGLRSDLELGVAGQVAVRQLYDAFNKPPSETAVRIAEEIVRTVRRHLKRKEEKKERKTA